MRGKIIRNVESYGRCGGGGEVRNNQGIVFISLLFMFYRSTKLNPR